MRTKSLATVIGILLSSAYGYISWFTTALKGSGLDILFVSSGTVLAPVGAAILWGLETIGVIADPGTTGGFVIFVLGAYVLWFCLFTLAAYFLIKKYTR